MPQTCRVFAAAAKRSAVWAGRAIVADALVAAASATPDARVASCRLGGLGASGAASAVVGVQGAWETASARATATDGGHSPQFQSPATKTGDSAVGEAIAALDLFPGDAPWLRSALSAAPASTAAGMVLGSHAGGAAAALPAFGGSAAHMVWCAAAVTVRPGVLVLAAPSAAGAGDTWPALRAYLPLTSASRRPVTVAAVSHRHVVFSSADGAGRPRSEGPFVSVVDLHRVDPSAFLSAAPSAEAVSASLGEAGIRAHKTISLTPPALARRQSADAPTASPLKGSAVSAIALLQAGAASASERCPALAAVGTYGRGPEGCAVFVLDLEAGTSLCAMWGHSKGINCLSIGHLPTAERRWSAWREARGDKAADGRPSDMWAALAVPGSTAADATSGAGSTAGSPSGGGARAAAAAWVERELRQLATMAPADAQMAVSAAVLPLGAGGAAAAGGGAAAAGPEGEAVEERAAAAAAILEAVATARGELQAAAAAGPADGTDRAAGEYGPRRFALHRPEGGPVGAQPVIPVPAPACPGRQAMQRAASAHLRGVVVTSGDRAGRLLTWDCASCQPVSVLQATAGQVIGVTLDAMTGHAVATAWPADTATELNVLTGQPSQCLGSGHVSMAAADWERGVAAVRTMQAEGDAAGGGGGPAQVVRYSVRSLWHPMAADGLTEARQVFSAALSDRGRSGSPHVAIRGDTMAFVHPGEGGRAEPTLRLVTVGATLAEARQAGAGGAGGEGACAVM